MKTEKYESYKTELSDILNEMDVPVERKDLNEHNLRWLQRNLGIRNVEHKSFYRAGAIITLLLIENEDK